MVVCVVFSMGAWVFNFVAMCSLLLSCTRWYDGWKKARFAVWYAAQVVILCFCVAYSFLWDILWWSQEAVLVWSCVSVVAWCRWGQMSDVEHAVVCTSLLQGSAWVHH